MTSSCNLFFGLQMSCFHFSLWLQKISSVRMSHIFITHLSVDRVVGWAHSLVWGPARLWTGTCRWHFGTLPQEGDSWLVQQLYIHRLRDFCTDFRSGGTSLHPHQQRIRLPSPTLSPALIIIIHSLGRCRYSFHFFEMLHMYWLCMCARVHARIHVWRSEDNCVGRRAWSQVVRCRS